MPDHRFRKVPVRSEEEANEAKKKQVTITVKEVKFRPGTDDHDYDYRMKHAREWLQDGDKVKATIWFRGREMTHRELGARILEKLEQDLADVGEVEARPRMEGNQMFIIFGPKRHKGGGGAKPDAPPPPLINKRRELTMPKLKTHKGAAKRFRLTATGKIKRGHSHARHILTKKTNKRKRQLDIDVLVATADHERVMSMLPYGRD